MSTVARRAREVRAALGAAQITIATSARRSVTLISACASGFSSFQSHLAVRRTKGSR